jgi:imidazolonepropionase
MAILFSNIKLLVNTLEKNHLLRGKELSNLPCISNAWLIIEGEEIIDYGPMSSLKHDPLSFSFHINSKDRIILPAWCDSHTHLVFAGSREQEFIDKIKGLSYTEIAAKGGGILNSAKLLNETSEDKLFAQSYKRLQEVMKLGTGAIEIKSGYGLSLDGELKMLRVIKRLKDSVKIPIKSTFLGAHAFPENFKQNKEGYVNSIINDMLPVISRDKLADYIDVFCEKGFFDPYEMEKIVVAGKKYGLKAKLHINQLSSMGGVQTAINLNAVSVDHLEVMENADITSLSNSNTIGTLLPSAAFFLRMPYQPARKLIDENCIISLASDYNPGTSPSGNMNFVVSLACTQMQMLPEEAINAATINGAYAMEVETQVGSITKGKKANLIISKEIPSLAYIPYSFGNNLIEKVMMCGEWL